MERQSDHSGNSVYQMACKNCPDFMYNYATMKSIWMQTCRSKGGQYREKARHFFTHSFGRFLKDTVFVVSYADDHTAGIFVDYKVYKLFKEKVEKAVEISGKLPDISPAKLSKKSPQIMRIFKNLKDFSMFTEQLKMKNSAIAKQRHLNGVYLLSKIAASMGQKETVVLAFNGEVSARGPKKLLQVGFVAFELHTGFEYRECRHYIVEENLSMANNNIVGNQFSTIGQCEVISLVEISSRLKQHISQAQFLLTYSMSSAEVRTFFASYGVETEGKEIIDALTLHFTLCPDSRKQNSMAEVLLELNVPFDSCNLQNAGYNAFYLAQIFRVLLSKEISLSC